MANLNIGGQVLEVEEIDQLLFCIEAAARARIQNQADGHYDEYVKWFEKISPQHFLSFAAMEQSITRAREKRTAPRLFESLCDAWVAGHRNALEFWRETKDKIGFDPSGLGFSRTVQ